MVDTEKISKILKDYRKDRHLTQQVLADHLCIRQKDISNLENNGSYTDSISKVCRVADFLNIPYEQIFENTIRDNSFIHMYDKKPELKLQYSEISLNRYKDNIPPDVQSAYQNIEEDTDMEYYDFTDDENIKALESSDEIQEAQIGALILSKNIRECIFGQKSYEGENQNVCVIGSSASGKTRAVVMPNIETCFGNYVIVKPEHESMSESRNQLISRGYNIIDFNMTHKDDKAILYDPFKNIDMYQDISDVNYEIFNIVNILTHNEENPFWKDAIKLLLTSIIACYISDKDNDDKMNFYDYFADLTQIQDDNIKFVSVINCMEEEVKKVKEKYKKLDTRYSLKEMAVKNFQMFNQNTLKSIITSVYLILENTKIYTTDSTPLKDLLYTPDTCIMVNIPSSDYNSYAMKVSLLMYQLFENGYKSTHHEALRFILDEFGNYDVPCISKFIALSRKCGIQIMTILQSVYQLKAKNLMNIINNSSYIVYLGSYSNEDNEYISRLCGYKTIARSKGDDKYKYTPKKTKIPVLSVKEIRSLGRDECIIINKDIAVKDKKYTR